MTPELITKIKLGLLIAVLAVLSLWSIFSYFEIRKHTEVINRQGLLIKLMFETPEINAVVSAQLRRLQDPSSVGTSTNPK